MKTKKLDRAWKTIEEIREKELQSNFINAGFLVGGALPQYDAGVKALIDEAQSSIAQLLTEHPDTDLPTDDYGMALNWVITSGPAEAMGLEKVLAPTGEIAERLRRIDGTYLEYLGIAMVVDGWIKTMERELPMRSVRTEEFTDEELMALLNRAVGLQADLYLMCLEDRRR